MSSGRVGTSNALWASMLRDFLLAYDADDDGDDVLKHEGSILISGSMDAGVDGGAVASLSWYACTLCT